MSQATVPLQPLSIHDDPKVVLLKVLSTDFLTSDSGLFVAQYYEAKRENAKKELEGSDVACARAYDSSVRKSSLRTIGWGSCGVVYKWQGTTYVVKRPLNGNRTLSEDCRLANDLSMHQAVENAFYRVISGALRLHVCIPRLQSFTSKTDGTYWSMHAQLFAQGDRTPEDLLISERIPPIHLVGREALIDCYCPDDLKAGARSQRSNDDCLVRLYLGKRRDQTTRVRPRRFFGLRNFPLCLDQVQDVGLDTRNYALAMAGALAVMHWEAKIDAADVEFVLGGPPCLTHVRPHCQLESKQRDRDQSTTSNLGSKATYIWLLDFNQCQPLPMNAVGIDHAVKRFFDNDPYYPRPPADPASSDMEVWESFESQYLEVSRGIIEDEYQALPPLFVERIKTVAIARQKKRDELAKVFENSSAIKADEE